MGKNTYKNGSGLLSLNIGSLSRIFQDILPAGIWDPYRKEKIRIEKKCSQEAVLTIVFYLMYTDRQVDTLKNAGLEFTPKDASNYFNNKRRVRGDIWRYAQKKDITDIIQQNIDRRLLKKLDKEKKEKLLEELKILVSDLPQDMDHMGLRSYLSLKLTEKGEDNLLLGRFLAKCIRFALLMPNTEAEQIHLDRINDYPDISRKNDPYRLVSGDSGSCAVELKLIDDTGYERMQKFYNYEHITAAIIQKNLIINSIEIKNGQICVHYRKFDKKGYKLRILKRSDFKAAREFVERYEDEFCRKRCWGERRLNEMVYDGLKSGKWTAYGYFDVDGRLISYLDVKVRIDGGVELGVMLTDKLYRGMHLASSLAFFFRLMFAGSRLFGGTYEKNHAMRQTFRTAGFVGIQYFDCVSGEKTEMIKERVNRMHPDEQEYDGYSVYYFSESILTCAFRSAG